MTDSDLFGFLDTFRSLTRVFPLRGEAHELQDVGKSYFKALRRFTFVQVKDAADKCIAECKHFPKPAEWVDRITRRVPIEIPELTPLEAKEWLTAERQRWEGDPCGCQSCQAASVTHRLLRFVPEFDADDRDRHARIGERIVTRGHWAHGEELRRWYAARDCFRERFVTTVAGKSLAKKPASFHERIEEIFKPRERS